MSIKSLIVFSISPVQSFIEQARKTTDLYAGSYLLSYLSRVAINKASKDYGATIIFPYKENESLPNRFLAEIEINDPIQLREIGEGLENTVKKEWINIGTTLLKKWNIKQPQGFEEQLSTHLHINWVFKSFSDERYSETYAAIEQFMGSVKNIRSFEQLMETGRKCSISGVHNALFYRGKRKLFADQAVEIPKSVPQKYLADGEHIGAVAFVKRFAEQYFESLNFNSSFASTAEIALMDILAQLNNAGKGYLIEKDNLEYHLIFDLKNRKPESEIFKDVTTDMLSSAEEIYKYLHDQKISFTPYYAVLLFDGDQMGKWFAGEKLRAGVSLKQFHAYLSEQLGNYANEARNILLYPNGMTVYAGGDDFLGFINLKKVFKVLTQLRQRFYEIDMSNYSDEKVSFSAGLVIAHYKTPLSEVLKQVRYMEKRAKEIDDEKDALGIAVLKHSGEYNQTVYKWTLENEWVTDIISRVIDRLSGNFSDNFIQQLNVEFHRLLNEQGAFHKEKSKMNKLVETEIKRLVTRSCLISKKDIEYRKKEISDFIYDLTNLLQHSKVENRYSLGNFLSLLNIATFIEREVATCKR